MAEDGSSANTAILAIFVIVVLALIAFFLMRGGDDTKKLDINVDVPQISQLQIP